MSKKNIAEEHRGLRLLCLGGRRVLRGALRGALRGMAEGTGAGRGRD